jgi:hypothetical protein
MNYSNAEIADVLEAAADIYESEKKEHCRGDYITIDGLSVCASGALRLACGAEEMIDRLGRVTITSWEFNEVPGFRYTLFEAAVVALFPQQSKDMEGYPDPGHPWQCAEDDLIGFNDGVCDIGSHDKAEIIELFKNKAKELRNRGETA